MLTTLASILMTTISPSSVIELPDIVITAIASLNAQSV
jgi:hypothetical protein